MTKSIVGTCYLEKPAPRNTSGVGLRMYYIIECSNCGYQQFQGNLKTAQKRCSTKSKCCNLKTQHPLYSTWESMIQRTTNQNNPQWKDYGGRGIIVCDEWRHDFEMFAYHMGPKPSPEYTLDRVDNDYIYCPENCRWASRTEQQNNNRKVVNAKGYHWHQASQKWKASISIDGQTRYLGTFETEQDARNAYLKAKQKKLQTL